MMKNRLTPIAALILSFAVFGCANMHTTPAETAIKKLGGTKWRLLNFTSMDDAVGTLKPASDQVYSLNLEKDGSVSMQLNCNRAMGSWSASAGADDMSGSFSFGPLASTRALCAPPSLDEKILQDAGFVKSYVIKNGQLHLSLMADGGIFTWEAAHAYLAPEDGGPRNWQVSAEAGQALLRDQADTNSTVLHKYEFGAILDNLGCRSVSETTWCDVQQLGGGPRGFVLASSLLPAVTPDGSVATGPDDSALRAGASDFDATGKVPCAFAPGQPTFQCEMGVARAGGGYATVIITKPEGRTRAIYFRMGRAIGADTSQADGYPAFSANKEADLTRVSIGLERYEIPDAVLFGG